MARRMTVRPNGENWSGVQTQNTSRGARVSLDIPKEYRRYNSKGGYSAERQKRYRDIRAAFGMSAG